MDELSNSNGGQAIQTMNVIIAPDWVLDFSMVPVPDVARDAIPMLEPKRASMRATNDADPDGAAAMMFKNEGDTVECDDSWMEGVNWDTYMAEFDGASSTRNVSNIKVVLGGMGL